MGPHGNRRSTRLKTDADLSAATAASGRPLQRWRDADAATAPAAELADMSLEATARDGSSKVWDQFAANKEKFGVVPSYDERFYTTRINTAHPDFARREQRARQLAKEIEGQDAGGNVHLAEERGAAVDDSGMDEEDRFSGVARARHEAFAAAEARRALASPSYLQRREQADRQEDLADLQSGGKAARPERQERQERHEPQERQDLGQHVSPPRGASPAAPGGSEQSPDDRRKKPARGDGKAKPKFNFAASAAKASSFKSSLSPSPRPSFSPMSMSASPSVVSPTLVPPMMAVPGAPPPPFAFAPPPPAGIPLGAPPPNMQMSPGPIMPPFSALSPYTSAPGSVDSRSRSGSAADSSVDVASIRPLGDAFDYIKVLETKQEEVPKMYATPPQWATTAQVSYVDQFPPPQLATRMPGFAPMGFMYPPQF